METEEEEQRHESRETLSLPPAQSIKKSEATMNQRKPESLSERYFRDYVALSAKQRSGKEVREVTETEDNGAFLMVLQGDDKIRLDNDKMTTSLEDDYERFMAAPAVQEYFIMMHLTSGILTILYQKIKTSDSISKCLQELSGLTRTTQNRKTLSNEAKTRLEKLTTSLMKCLTSKSLLNYPYGCTIDSNLYKCLNTETIKMFSNLAHHRWKARVKHCVTQLDNSKSGGAAAALDQVSVLENIFGFNVTNKLAQHIETWRDAIIAYLSEKDFYHMKIASYLEGTAKQFETFYAPIQNRVTFKALVALTIWFNEKPEDYLQKILARGQQDLFLVYGSLKEDYETLLNRYHYGFQGELVALHLIYINFQLSRNSDAIELNFQPLTKQLEEIQYNHKPVYSFGTLFLQDLTLDLSEMRREPAALPSEEPVIELKSMKCPYTKKDDNRKQRQQSTSSDDDNSMTSEDESY